MKIEKWKRAWCAGFFDGEGHVGRYVTSRSKKTGKKFFGVRVMVNQKDPAPLRQFKRLIGFGILGGPYQAKDHCPLYVWRVSNREQCNRLFKLLFPFLSKRRVRQFQIALKGYRPLKST